MNKKTFVMTNRFLSIIFIFFLAISAIAAISKSTTMDNLNKALKGETNASHKYELFAKEADAEGYTQIAKLFRAVSMAESVHRNNHKAVILSLGGKPDIISYDKVIVKTTKENLKSPLKGEAYEKNVMYPNFIKQANVDKIPSAVKTFSYAENAEKQHEQLFKDALKNIGKNTPVDYCVSKISGATYAKSPSAPCPQSKCGVEDEYIRIK